MQLLEFCLPCCASTDFFFANKMLTRFLPSLHFPARGHVRVHVSTCITDADAVLLIIYPTEAATG